MPQTDSWSSLPPPHACWQTGPKSETISTHPLRYLFMSPGSASIYGVEHSFLLMWSSSIDAHIAPGLDYCSHKHGVGLFDGILWHSSNSRHLPLRQQAMTWESNNMFNNYRSDIVWDDCHLVWNGNSHTTTAHSWMWLIQNTAFEAIGEISTSGKEGWLG